MIDENRVYSWPEIRRIGNSKLVQGTILIPFLGYLIIFSEWFFEFIGEPEGFRQTWKIYCLYYGFTVTAVGSLVYNFRCPKVIRLYGSPAEYVAREEQLFSKANMAVILIESYRIIKKYNVSAWNTAGVNAQGMYDRMGLIKDENEIFKHLRTASKKVIDEGKKIEFISSFYLLNTYINPKSRWFVFVTYVCGFVLVLIPSIAMFIEVILKTFGVLSTGNP